MKERGSILLLTQIIMLLVLSLSFTCLALLPTEILLAKSHLKSSQAFYLAEAGVEDCLLNFASDRDWQPEVNEIPLGDGCYRIKIENTHLGKKLLLSGSVPLDKGREIVRRVSLEVRFWELNPLFKQAVNENASWPDDFQPASPHYLAQEIKADCNFSGEEYFVDGDLKIADGVHLTGSGIIYVAGDLYLGERTRVGMTNNDRFLLLVAGNVYTEYLAQIKGILWAKGDVFLKRFAWVYGALACQGSLEKEEFAKIIYTMETFYRHPLIFQPVFQVTDYQYLGGGE